MNAKTDHLSCPRCLSFLSQGKVCSLCARGGLSGIERAYAPYIYRDEARQLVIRLKFGPCEEAGPPLAQAMAQAITGQDFDLMVPVPLYRDNQRERGFNQAELLARILQRFRPDLPLQLALEKTAKTRRQSSLRHDDRFENTRNKYRAIVDVRGKTILLVDDVRTTGATAQDCARALKEAGAKAISLLTATVAA
ncbi:MAG: phosphoribosyltransferase family protein [Eubacteriales bacterium]|nr:phosphoribosyltransferase family protein [Eubacteriales bacterium]